MASQPTQGGRGPPASHEPHVFGGQFIARNLGSGRPPVRIAGHGVCRLDSAGVTFEGFVPRTDFAARLRCFFSGFDKGLPAKPEALKFSVPWDEVDLVEKEWTQATAYTGNVLFLLKDGELTFRPTGPIEPLLDVANANVPETLGRYARAVSRSGLVPALVFLVAGLALLLAARLDLVGIVLRHLLPAHR